VRRESGSVAVGIVGCGRAGCQLHVPALRAIGIRVSAVADPDPERRRAAAAAAGSATSHADHGALLARGDVDLVAICTPAHAHARIAIDALAAGKHVYVEKPIALRIEEADAMVRAAASARTRATLGFQLRSHRLVERARAIVRSGRLGALELVRSVWTANSHSGAADAEWRSDPARGGGALFEIGVHHFDLWRHLLGEEVASVQTLPGDDPGRAVVHARSASGIPCTAAFSQRSADSNAWEIVGRDATLAFSCYGADSLRVEDARATAGGVRRRVQGAARAVRGVPELVRAARSGGDYLEAYRRHWATFLAAVRGEREVSCTLEDGRQALRLVLAALESSRSGATVAPETAPAAGAAR
jgi:predicted dehydrogenase